MGQQQRVAVARALANKPKLVLADEPTGNLDPKNSRAAIDLIQQLCDEEGSGLMLVSHDLKVVDSFPKQLSWASLNRVISKRSAHERRRAVDCLEKPAPACAFTWIAQVRSLWPEASNGSLGITLKADTFTEANGGSMPCWVPAVRNFNWFLIPYFILKHRLEPFL